MIVSHRHRFIFIKTRKTASTSIQIALSEFCGPDDILTPIIDEGEPTKGYRGPRNDAGLNTHSPARAIREHLGDELWSSYFKFCFERNPFDKAVSRYYWSPEPRPPMSDYLQDVPSRLLSSWNMYTRNDHLDVDFVGHYETLADDVATVSEKLGLPGELVLPHAKAGHRRDRRHYSQILDERARARIELVAAKELVAFSYRWKEEPRSGR